jgi:hypothetical protein
MALETRKGESGTGAPATAGRPVGGNVARLSRRRSTYRGELGMLVSGQDTHGRRVRVFVPDNDPNGHTGESVVTNVRAGRRAFAREDR